MINLLSHQFLKEISSLVKMEWVFLNSKKAWPLAVSHLPGTQTPIMKIHPSIWVHRLFKYLLFQEAELWGYSYMLTQKEGFPP